MIIRSGFVSNSSSSSFIVIGSSLPDVILTVPVYVIGENGETKFGWDFEIYSDFDSRVNFSFLQALSRAGNESDDWLLKLFDILETNLKGEVQCKLIEAWSDPFDNKYESYPDWLIQKYLGYQSEFSDQNLVGGYIDHQSAYCDGVNIEMFETDEKLYNFLFCTDSYIETGNDNDCDYND